jgi:SAM-dependent methyltransferase
MNSLDPNSPDRVEEQYSQYSYPEPGEDIPSWLKSWNYAPYDPSLYEALHWPEGRPRRDLDILVAGCGTMQAAVLAFNNPECKITGIDFSQTSIAHEEKLRARHNLKNLELQKMDLRDAHKLGRSYDLIVSTGVLHHLADPNEGLKAIASVLEPKHGAMLVMLYGRIARTGVYALQDSFRRMGVPQTADGIKLVRATIQHLPPRHPARWYFDTSPEMNSDAAIVDTFLHTQDTAYSVSDVLDFVEKNGLAFKGWLDSALYNQDMAGVGYNIPDRDRWSIVENLSGRMGQHRFMVSSPERDSKSEITFEGNNWLDYFPQRNPELQPSNFDPNKCVRGAHEFIMSPPEAVLLTESNGRKPIAQIMKHKSLAKLESNKRTALAIEFYQRMWRLGHVFYSAVPSKRRHNEATP